MKSNAVASGYQTLSYIKLLERDRRRLQPENEKLAGEALAAKTAAAHLRDEMQQMRPHPQESSPCAK